MSFKQQECAGWMREETTESTSAAGLHNKRSMYQTKWSERKISIPHKMNDRKNPEKNSHLI